MLATVDQMSGCKKTDRQWRRHYPCNSSCIFYRKNNFFRIICFQTSLLCLLLPLSHSTDATTRRLSCDETTSSSNIRSVTPRLLTDDVIDKSGFLLRFPATILRKPGIRKSVETRCVNGNKEEGEGSDTGPVYKSNDVTSADRRQIPDSGLTPYTKWRGKRRDCELPLIGCRRLQEKSFGMKRSGVMGLDNLDYAASILDTSRRRQHKPRIQPETEANGPSKLSLLRDYSSDSTDASRVLMTSFMSGVLSGGGGVGYAGADLGRLQSATKFGRDDIISRTTSGQKKHRGNEASTVIPYPNLSTATLVSPSGVSQRRHRQQHQSSSKPNIKSVSESDLRKMFRMLNAG